MLLTLLLIVIIVIICIVLYFAVLYWHYALTLVLYIILLYVYCIVLCHIVIGIHLLYWALFHSGSRIVKDSSLGVETIFGSIYSWKLSVILFLSPFKFGVQHGSSGAPLSILLYLCVFMHIIGVCIHV